jgi:hypothetical protein
LSPKKKKKSTKSMTKNIHGIVIMHICNRRSEELKQKRRKTKGVPKFRLVRYQVQVPVPVPVDIPV